MLSRDASAPIALGVAMATGIVSRRPMPSPPRRSTQRGSAIDLRTRTAYHEAGHAVLSAAINDKPHHVSIRGEHGTLGRSGQKMFARPTSLAQVYLAGFAAEHIATGRRPRQYNEETGLGILAHTDPAVAETFKDVETCDGFGAVQEVLRTGVRPVEDELRGEVDRLYEVARESLAMVWPSVKALVEVLLEREEVDRDAIDEAIGDADIYAPVFAVQQAHGLLRVVRPPHRAALADHGVVEASMKPAGKPAKKEPATAAKSAAAADRRIATLLKALRANPKLATVVDAYEKQAAERGRGFGKNGLKTKSGKLFALFTQGTLVVKLPNERVADLVASGVGEQFDPGHGRLMKGWLTVTRAKASWADLAKEAYEHVTSAEG